MCRALRRHVEITACTVGTRRDACDLRKEADSGYPLAQQKMTAARSANDCVVILVAQNGLQEHECLGAEKISSAIPRRAPKPSPTLPLRLVRS